MAFRAVHEKKIAVGMEGTYGVLGSYRAAIPCEFKADYKRDSYIKEGLNGPRFDVSTYKREGNLTGNISMSVTSADVGDLLKAFYGTVQTTGAGGTYTHVFTPVGTIADTFPSVSLQCDYGQATTYDYTGVRVDKVAFSCNAKEDMKVSFDFIGKNESVGTAINGTYSTLNPITFNQMTLYVDGTLSALTPRNISLELNQALGDGYRVGTDYNCRRPLPTKRMEGVVKFDLEFENVTQRNKYLGGSYTGIRLVWEGEVFSETQKQTIDFRLPKVNYNTAPFETFDGLLGLTVSGMVLDGTNSTGTGGCMITLKNGVTVY
jgi:hypothetical protein